MSSYIRYEALLFVQALLCGAVMLLCYGVLTALRKVVPHHPYVTAFEDLLYWILTGFLVFAGIYRTNQGILRCFLFLGIALGAWLSQITVRPVFEKICVLILGIPALFVKFSTKRLLFLVKRCKIFLYKFACPVLHRKKRQVMRSRRGREVEKIEKKGKQKENWK